MNPADRMVDAASDADALTYADYAAIAPALSYADLDVSVSWSDLRRATRVDVVRWLVAARAIVARGPVRGRAIGVSALASRLEGELHAPRGPPTTSNRRYSPLHILLADPVARVVPVESLFPVVRVPFPRYPSATLVTSLDESCSLRSLLMFVRGPPLMSAGVLSCRSHVVIQLRPASLRRSKDDEPQCFSIDARTRI